MCCVAASNAWNRVASPCVSVSPVALVKAWDTTFACAACLPPPTGFGFMLQIIPKPQLPAEQHPPTERHFAAAIADNVHASVGTGCVGTHSMAHITTGSRAVRMLKEGQHARCDEQSVD